MDNDRPVTRSELDAALKEVAEDLKEFMRQIETNLLTGFHSYSRGVSSHFHTLDTTAADMNTRPSALEDRILAVETRRPL